MAVDLETLKASLVARETLEAATTEKFPTEDEATQESIVLAAQTIWALIDDLEAANELTSSLETRVAILSRTATDIRLQPLKPVRYSRA